MSEVAMATTATSTFEAFFEAERVGPVIQSGNYVAFAANYPGASLIFVCELAKPTPAEPTPNGQISHMWGIANQRQHRRYRGALGWPLGAPGRRLRGPWPRPTFPAS